MAEHDLRSIAFPRLSNDQVAKLGRCSATALKTYREARFCSGSASRT